MWNWSIAPCITGKRMHLPPDSAKCCIFFFYGGDDAARSACKELLRIDRSILLQADNVDILELTRVRSTILDRPLIVSPIIILQLSVYY